jgi:hypothetical protein
MAKTNEQMSENYVQSRLWTYEKFKGRAIIVGFTWGLREASYANSFIGWTYTLWHIRSLETYASLRMLGKFCACFAARGAWCRCFDEEEHSFLVLAMLS